MELGFWIPIVDWIPDSLSCIPDSKASAGKISRISALHQQKFPLPGKGRGGGEGRLGGFRLSHVTFSRTPLYYYYYYDK